MRRIITLLVLIPLAAFGLGAGVATANHQFSDVPDSVRHHVSIGRVVGAGIATGFDDGTFRPRDPVTRGQFASWMNRGGGRVGSDTGQVVADVNNAEEIVASVFADSGGVGELATGGFIHVTGSLDAVTDDDVACPCLVKARITMAGAITSHERFVNVPGGPNGAGQAAASLTIDWVFPVEANAGQNLSLRAKYIDADVDNVTFTGELVTTYVPFGPDGGNQLDP